MKSKHRATGVIWAISFIALLFFPLLAEGAGNVQKKSALREVTLDFIDVDLPVLVKLVSELTGKNFVIDEKVRGKVSIISPNKIPVNRVFDVFLSVLELKGLTVVESGEVYLIRPFAEVKPDREVFVYRLENMKSEEIAKVLRGLVSKTAGRGKQRRSGGKGFSGHVLILTDKETNSLIITATTSDFKILKGVIKKLDLKRRQVYVEAVVMELSADKFKEIGTDISAAFGGRVDLFSKNDLGIAGGINGLDFQGLFRDASSAGIALGAANLQVILRALKSSSDVNILSTPQILTTDKHKAEIVVAQNVPFPGAQSQTSGGNVQTTIERKDVGIILRLTPTVLDDDRVQLDVYQEISSVVDSVVTSGAVNLGPTTSKRSASTTVIAHSGQTIVIGGLIKDNLITIDRKVPFLGDIPLIGWLFHFKSSRIEKTNLMIFLTPYIIHSKEELTEIKNQKAKDAGHFIEKNLPLRHQEGRTASFNEMIDLPR